MKYIIFAVIILLLCRFFLRRNPGRDRREEKRTPTSRVIDISPIPSTHPGAEDRRYDEGRSAAGTKQETSEGRTRHDRD